MTENGLGCLAGRFFSFLLIFPCLGLFTLIEKFLQQFGTELSVGLLFHGRHFGLIGRSIRRFRNFRRLLGWGSLVRHAGSRFRLGFVPAFVRDLGFGCAVVVLVSDLPVTIGDRLNIVV